MTEQAPEQGTRPTAAPFGRPEIDDRGGVYAGGIHDPRDTLTEADLAQRLAAQQAAAVAEAQQAAAAGTATPGQQATAASGQAGVTEVDVAALIAAMQAQMAVQQAQIASLLAQQGPVGEHPLIATAKALRHHLADNGDKAAHAPAVALADDLVEASANAVESGDLSSVKAIHAKLERWLKRNPVPPGESYHHRQVADLVTFHVPDQVDVFTPRPKAPAVAGGAPVPVIAGSVVG